MACKVNHMLEPRCMETVNKRPKRWKWNQKLVNSLHCLGNTKNT